MDLSNGNLAGKRGALSFYCTCTQRPHARRTRFCSHRSRFLPPI